VANVAEELVEEAGAEETEFITRMCRKRLRSLENLQGHLRKKNQDKKGQAETKTHTLEVDQESAVAKGISSAIPKRKDNAKIWRRIKDGPETSMRLTG
jgi:hypothetical protein